MARDLRTDEIEKINNWLNYLVCGVENNGLSKESLKEINHLSCRCFDIVEERERNEKAWDKFPM